MSYWIQMDCLRILDGTYGSLELIHTHTAFGLTSIICQNGYLMIPGVLYSTPASRNRFFCFCCDPERLCTPGPLYISLHPGQKSDPVWSDGWNKTIWLADEVHRKWITEGTDLPASWYGEKRTGRQKGIWRGSTRSGVLTNGSRQKPQADPGRNGSWTEDYKHCEMFGWYKIVYIVNVLECVMPVHTVTFRYPEVMNEDVISGVKQRFMKKKLVFS